MPQPTKSLRAWIITHHAPILPQYGSIPPGDMVIAVDQGLEVTHLVGLKPSLIIGDFDSLPSLSMLNDYADTPIATFDPHKNETDTELAVTRAIQLGATEIVICNDMGGRIDHALAIIPLLEYAERQGVVCRIETGEQTLFMLKDTQELDYPVGSLVSLLPLSEDAVFTDSEGLQYPLEQLVLSRRETRGISNRITTSPAMIHMSRGEVLTIITIL